MNWGLHIKKIRESKGLTQVELASCMGISRSALSLIELGKVKTFEVTAMHKFARCLDTDYHELLDIVCEVPDRPAAESPERLLEKLRLATPIAIPVYNDFPFEPGKGVEPLEYMYVARTRAEAKNLEAYPVGGKSLDTEIRANDIIVVDRRAHILNGNIIAAKFKNELHLGFLKKIGQNEWFECEHGRIKIGECQAVALITDISRRINA